MTATAGPCPWPAGTALAIAGAQQALTRAGRGMQARDVAVTQDRDSVTATDTAIEDLIRDRIGQSLGDRVTGEERGGQPLAAGG